MIEAFAVTYLAVLAAEVVGDKFLYTTSILATRYRPTPLMLGLTLAFMVKMGAAVLVGGWIAGLPRPVLGVVTAIGVAWVALRFWGSGGLARGGDEQSSSSEALMVSCASVLFSEWADLGQLTAAAIAVRFNSPFVVWCGAVSAMLTKGILAATLGARIRAHFRDRLVPPTFLYVSVGLLLLTGVISVAETLFAQR